MVKLVMMSNLGPRDDDAGLEPEHAGDHGDDGDLETECGDCGGASLVLDHGGYRGDVELECGPRSSCEPALRLVLTFADHHDAEDPQHGLVDDQPVLALVHDGDGDDEGSGHQLGGEDPERGLADGQPVLELMHHDDGGGYYGGLEHLYDGGQELEQDVPRALWRAQ